MKLLFLALFLLMFSFNNLFANEQGNTSISFAPLTFLGLFFGSGENVDFRNMWFAMDINWETRNQREMGVGTILRGNRIAVKTQYRMFYNRELQRGFFWGLYGVIDWRRLFWFYDDNNVLTIGSSFPYAVYDNQYHSIGVSGGLDIGFRFRSGNFGITPFFGLGIPVFHVFGDLPPSNYKQEFRVTKAVIRAINIGLRLDFFVP